MQLRNTTTDKRKGGADTYLISAELEKELDTLIHAERSRKYLTWTSDMDQVLLKYEEKGAGTTTLVTIMTKAFPKKYFTYDRIYRRLVALGRPHARRSLDKKSARNPRGAGHRPQSDGQKKTYLKARQTKKCRCGSRSSVRMEYPIDERCSFVSKLCRDCDTLLEQDILI